LRALFTVNRLARAFNESRPDIGRAVSLFRHGQHDNPWAQDTVLQKIHAAGAALEKAVKGQNFAIEQMLDRLKRSVLGMSGAHVSATSRRPRVVMMLAGPTGVGKTELVRALTRHLFGSEEMYTRFDMSEFSAAHADQRLVGAPPSYVGYEQGGELTNAVRRKPFSVLLFDEIEKAHPHILDKFLQILEDGRLTDGRGHTVYFAECLLFFTTNLGVYRNYQETPNGAFQRALAVPYDSTYADLESAVRQGISHEFRSVIGRPEIENRLGENIVVFDFIRPPVVQSIVQAMQDRVVARAGERGFELQISNEVRTSLVNAASQACQVFGGRGIGNVVEQQLVNPLARAMFECRVAGRSDTLIVKSILSPSTAGAAYTLKIEQQRGAK
jgi:ATP-dependent Clp protease ATP-binding subunit ClpA